MIWVGEELKLRAGLKLEFIPQISVDLSYAGEDFADSGESGVVNHQ